MVFRYSSATAPEILFEGEKELSFFPISVLNLILSIPEKESFGHIGFRPTSSLDSSHFQKGLLGAMRFFFPKSVVMFGLVPLNPVVSWTAKCVHLFLMLNSMSSIWQLEIFMLGIFTPLICCSLTKLCHILYDPWTARRSNQSILKEISPDYSLEGLRLKLKL